MNNPLNIYWLNNASCWAKTEHVNASIIEVSSIFIIVGELSSQLIFKVTSQSQVSIHLTDKILFNISVTADINPARESFHFNYIDDIIIYTIRERIVVFV